MTYDVRLAITSANSRRKPDHFIYYTIYLPDNLIRDAGLRKGDKFTAYIAKGTKAIHIKLDNDKGIHPLTKDNRINIRTRSKVVDLHHSEKVRYRVEYETLIVDIPEHFKKRNAGFGLLNKVRGFKAVG